MSKQSKKEVPPPFPKHNPVYAPPFVHHGGQNHFIFQLRTGAPILYRRSQKTGFLNKNVLGLLYVLKSEPPLRTRLSFTLSVSLI